VFSATATDFDIAGYITGAGGRLATYKEYLGSTGWTTGPEAFRRLAYENSMNPRLLLAVLDYESRWVQAESVDAVHNDYPMGYLNPFYKGMFSQMVWAVNQLSIGYYGWRTGTLTELQFPDGTHLRLNPRLNAATVAIQYLFSRVHARSQWAQMINPANGFLAVHADVRRSVGRGDTVDPVLPPGLNQPKLSCRSIQRRSGASQAAPTSVARRLLAAIGFALHRSRRLRSHPDMGDRFGTGFDCPIGAGRRDRGS
jgi:hypothetical protein